MTTQAQTAHLAHKTCTFMLEKWSSGAIFVFVNSALDINTFCSLITEWNRKQFLVSL